MNDEQRSFFRANGVRAQPAATRVHTAANLYAVAPSASTGRASIAQRRGASIAQRRASVLALTPNCCADGRMLPVSGD